MWNNYTRHQVTALMVLHCLANLSIGLGLLLFANISAESILSRYSPWWLWPCMFILAGFIAVGGVFNRKAAKFSYAFAAIVTGVVGLASLWAVVVDGRLVAIPTTVFLLYIMVLKLVVSNMISQRENAVDAIVQTTEYAQSVLDRVTDGTTDT